MELDSYLSEKQKKRRKRQRFGRAIVVCGILCLVVIGGVWLVFRSPLFLLKGIAVQGNDAVPSGSVTALLQSSALRDHNFWKSLLGIQNMLIYPRALTTSDLAFIPQLASVALTKDYWTHAMTATVTERTPAGIWCLMAGPPPAMNAPAGNVSDASSSASAPVNINSGENCYWFDGTGMLYGRTFDTEGSLMFAVHDYSQSGLGVGGTILPAEFVPNLISILNVLKESNIDVDEVALTNIALQEIDVTTYNGPDLYFSLRFPADPDLAVLQNVMAEPGFAKLQYIDFRVDNRAFYK